MIEVDRINKSFKILKKEPGVIGGIKSLISPKYIVKEAVKNISFNINEGEIVGYIGPNGAGKSTTIKMLSGILYQDKGDIKINNLNPFENRKKHNKNIGVVFGQRGQLWRDLEVEDSFILLKNIYDVTNENYKKRMEFINQYLDIESLMYMPVRKLSLGQKMRCEFAASILHNPKILFLDEPTIGLDIITRKNLLKAIKALNEKFKTTIILTTHNISDIESLCSRVIVIDKGLKLFDGTVDDLINLHSKDANISLEDVVEAIYEGRVIP